MTPEQEKALALARARKRKAEAGGALPQEVKDRIAAAKAGTLKEADPARQAEIDRQAEVNMRDPGALMSALLPMAQGATFGFADEIAAGALAPFMDATYGQLLATARGGVADARFSRPKTALAGEVLGAVSSPVNKALLPAKGSGLLVNALRGAASGAAGGALYGYGSGEGVSDRLANGATGMVVGGALGGAIPVVAEVGKSVWRAGADAYRGSQIGKEVGNALGVSPQAARVVGGIVGSDDVAAMRASLNAAGPDAMLADASPALGQTLDGAIRSPVPGSRVAFDRIESRAGQSYDDLMGAVGKAAPVQETMEGIRTGSAPARKAAYDLAYAQPIDYAGTPPIDPATTLASSGVNLPAIIGDIADPEAGKRLLALQDRLPAKAISYANELMRLNGEQSKQIMASIADDGSVKFTTLPDVRQWDYIKQALNQLAESGDGAGALGGQTRMGAAYESLAKSVRDNLAAAVPEYRKALAVASDAITERNAVRFGSEMLSPKTTTYDALQAIKDATPAQIEAMKAGVRGQLDEAIGNVRMVPSDQNIDARQAIAAFKELTSPNAQKKLEALFGGDWPTIKAQLDRAGAALGLRARTAGNSATAGRLMADRAIEEAVTPNPLRAGKPMDAAKDFIGGMTGASPAAVSRLRDAVKGEIADLLTRQGGAPQNSLGVVLNALAAHPVNPNSGQRVYNALATGGFGLIPQAVGAANMLRTR